MKQDIQQKEQSNSDKENLKEKPKVKSPKKKKDDFSIDTDQLIEAGLYFGHRTSRINPKMNQYIQGVRNNVHIINVDTTKKKFIEALEFIQNLIVGKKILLFVGTKVQNKDLVAEVANECGLPYVNQRWLGGTFTNFGVIKKRIEYFKKLESDKEEGGWDKYTKKERIKMQRELENLKLKFEGLKEVTRLPDAIFVCDIRKDYLAIKEAREKGIKVIGIADTNVDPELADYPIPANDDAISSIKYILEKIKEVILKSKEKQA